MSLTSLLDDKTSALFRFMELELPETSAVAKAYRMQLPAIEVLRPQLPQGVNPVWGTLNTAIDHRLRYSLAPAESDGAVAGGVQLVDGATHRAGRRLLTHVKQLQADCCPYDRRHPVQLSPPAEEALARACFVEAWYEEVYRTKRV